ncbi:hypothetical protein GCM10009806_20470 [Microbacterium flavum]|uniref:Right-handed parallel beta-helix repeat-containing protein n=1 Tax=Microbacterium flavum TaxID=415216 RepID=A0ABS5XWT1_9MICO|nr:right-handed parallel beta-helix repeat-containing protein [Microbacterium flavum]
MTTVYDVTTFSASVSPYTDIGTVINEIIADIKAQQTSQTTRPGAVIYIPPGHYDLRTRVVIDISYLQIKGSGHGFQSLAIRDESPTGGWADTLPGGSHIQMKNTDGTTTAFLVQRSGSPAIVGRINSVEFRDFVIDGVSASKPYLPGSGKVGISIQSDNDSIRIEGMGFVYLSTAMSVRGADAAWVTGNFVAECGTCLELTGASQVVRVSNNFLISAWAGASVFAENAEGLLVQGNTLVWHGSIRLVNSQRCAITGNKFVSSWAGMVILESGSGENLVAANQFTRVDTESSNDNGRDDLFGMIQISGSNNSVLSNHMSYNVAGPLRRPSGATPTLILVKSGDRNVINGNTLVANVAASVVLDASTTNTKVIYTTTAAQLQAFTASFAHVPMP